MAKIFNINGKKILFIHIPKNAGRCLSQCLKKFETQVIPGHPNLRQIIDIWGQDCITEVDIILYTKRDVFDRAVSIYNYFRNTEISDHNHYFEHWYFKSNSFEASMKYLSEHMTDEKNLTKSYYGKTYGLLAIQNQKDYTDTSFIQNNWLKDHINEKIFYIEVQNIRPQVESFLKFFKIEETEIKEIMNILPIAKKTTASIRTKDTKLSEKEIEIVKHIYGKDFNLFGNPISKLWSNNEIK